MISNASITVTYQIAMLVTLTSKAVDQRTGRRLEFSRCLSGLGENWVKCIRAAQVDFVRLADRKHLTLIDHVKVTNIRQDRECPAVIVLNIQKEV